MNPQSATNVCALCEQSVTSHLIFGGRGTRSVWAHVCPTCDTRTCGWKTDNGLCDAKVRDLYAKKCPRGHVL